MKPLLGIVFPVCIILYIEVSKAIDSNAIIPFLLLYVGTVCSAYLYGKKAGLYSAALCSFYILYSALTVYGPKPLTGGVLPVSFGFILYMGTAYFIGKALDERRRYYDKLIELNIDLFEELNLKTTEVENRDERYQEAVENLHQEREEHHKTKQKLYQVQKLETIGSLTAGIAHDFNNILTPIIGFLGMSVALLKEDSKERLYIDKASIAALRARDLVHRILSFSKDVEPTYQSMDLNEVLQEIILFISEIIPKSIRLEVRIPESPHFIYGNSIQIHQVFMNLCTNAIQAMQGKKGVLSLTAHADEKRILVEVSDTGKGMTDETIKKIFTPFYTTKDKGTGLGLSISKGIVKAHKGTITVMSTIGKGTTFQVSFEATNTKELAETNRNVELSLKGKHILCLDDEETILFLLKELLIHSGAKVTTFKSPQLALKKFSLNPEKFHLIISDYLMPEMNGEEFYKEIRKISDVPIIVMTGISKIPSNGQADYNFTGKLVYKPFIKNELFAVIKSALK